MQKKISDLTGDLISSCGHLAFAVTERTTPLLQSLGTSRVSVSTELSDLLREAIDLRSEIVTFGRDLSALLVEFGDRGQITQGSLVTSACERGANSVIVGTDTANVNHGSEP